METNLIFIYDGECPFCAHFAELLELKSGISGIEFKDARENPSEIPNGYDMDKKGALLIKDNQILNGAEAINWICSQINNPTDSLLRLLSVTFSSRQRTYFLFPILLNARRFLLRLKGVPRKLIFSD